MEAKCPICSKKQTQKPLKSWKYGESILTNTTSDGLKFGPSITCSRYACKCGKTFNQYYSVKGKSWTIPKKK